MAKQKKSLIVTLADENYIKQAKQLFSSVYFNAGWKGDYMLLSHEIPEKDLKWFRKKGILIKKCKPLKKTDKRWATHIFLDKFYLFTPKFKKWNVIVYLDADIIVRGSLNELTKVNGFSAVRDINNNKISVNFEGDEEEISKLNSIYCLNKEGFNAGVLAINTRIIKKETFDDLIKLNKKYSKISAFGDQPILNIYFQEIINFLPTRFNFYIPKSTSFIEKVIVLPKTKANVLHFCGKNEKPWFKENHFYREWVSNLEKAELINLKETQKQKMLNRNDICISPYIIYLKLDNLIGKIGKILRKLLNRLKLE